jgi:Cytochrome P450
VHASSEGLYRRSAGAGDVEAVGIAIDGGVAVSRGCVGDEHSFKVFSWNAAEGAPAILAAWDELDAYIDNMAAQRRRSLTDDLLSDLIRAEDDGDRLSTDELRMLVAGLLMAGTDTTRNQLAARRNENPGDFNVVDGGAERAESDGRMTHRLLDSIACQFGMVGEQCPQIGVITQYLHRGGPWQLHLLRARSRACRSRSPLATRPAASAHPYPLIQGRQGDSG